MSPIKKGKLCAVRRAGCAVAARRRPGLELRSRNPKSGERKKNGNGWIIYYNKKRGVEVAATRMFDVEGKVEYKAGPQKRANAFAQILRVIIYRSRPVPSRLPSSSQRCGP